MTVLDAVSLFSNCGAGDVGYAGAGFRFRVLAELVPHRLEVALLNHRSAEGVEGDLRLTLPTVVGRWRALRGSEPPALLAACPPCQGLSSARSHRGKGHDAKAGSRDPRNLLVQVVAEAVQSLRPRAVVVENVPAFLTRQVLHPKTAEPVSAAVLLIDALSEKYEVFPLLADLAHFGVPQVRKRSFLTFIRRGEAGLALLRQRSLVPYPSATHADRPITLRQALEDMGLPSLDASTPTSAVDPAQPLHAVPVWADRRYGMVAAIPPHSGRSAWENDQCEECGKVNVGDDDAVCPNCGRPLLRPVVVKDGVVRLVSGFRTSSYGRMHPDRPAATITTASGHVGSDKTIHPWENRLMSTLECARLQTFPETFRWGDALETKGHTNVRDMIGEAVPPLFTRQHGRVLAALLEGRRPNLVMSTEDKRVKKAVASLEAAGAAAASRVSA